MKDANILHLHRLTDENTKMQEELQKMFNRKTTGENACLHFGNQEILADVKQMQSILDCIRKSNETLAKMIDLERTR